MHFFKTTFSEDLVVLYKIVETLSKSCDMLAYEVIVLKERAM